MPLSKNEGKYLVNSVNPAKAGQLHSVMSAESPTDNCQLIITQLNSEKLMLCSYL